MRSKIKSVFKSRDEALPRVYNNIFLKTKRIFSGKFLVMSLAVAVVTAIGVGVPASQAQAQAIGWSLYHLFNLFGGGAGDAITSTITAEAAKAGMTAIYTITGCLLNLTLEVVSWGVGFAAFFIDVMLNPNLYHNPAGAPPGVLDSSAINIGWTTVRDMCNTFFIFFLLLIAFAMILRIQKFGSTKTLLVKFILSIFLINFSMVIAKIIIDVGQVFMYEIVTWMPSGFQGKASGLTTIVDSFKNEINFRVYEFDTVIKALFAVIYSIMLMLIYIMLAIFLLIRLIMFAILIILSPFAFLSLVLPSMSKYTNEWFDTLIKYTIFGPVFLFFIFLSATMANELMGLDYITSAGLSAPKSTSESFARMIGLMIPHVVALCMLYAVIPVTQKLGGAASQRFIGGTMGLGKIAIGGYAGMKIAGGLGKKAVVSPVSRGHAYFKEKSEGYDKLSKSVSGGLKKLPVGGRTFIKIEAESKEKKKVAVAKHEKIMETLPDKDRKNYVDSFKLDKKGQAEAQQAMFNLIAKDSGKGMTNTRFQKMGYEKDKLDANGNIVKDANGNNIKVFDEEKVMRAYGKASAYGMDTSNVEKYRPDLIKDKDDRIDKVRKTVADGDEKSIKLDSLADEGIAKELKELLGKKRYDSLINNKSQEERNGLVKIKESKIAKGIKEGTIDPTDRVIMRKYQKEIANLASPQDKEKKMMENVRLDVNQNIVYSGNVDMNLAGDVMKETSKDQFLDLDAAFLKKYGHIISETNIKHIDKFGDTENLEAIKEALEKSVRHTPGVSLPAGFDTIKAGKRLSNIENKISL